MKAIRQRYSPACERTKVERMCHALGRYSIENDAPVTVWTSPRDPKNDRKVAELKENSGLEIFRCSEPSLIISRQFVVW